MEYSYFMIYRNLSKINAGGTDDTLCLVLKFIGGVDGETAVKIAKCIQNGEKIEELL